MGLFGTGVKLVTLPATAFGVRIGADYGRYFVNVQLVLLCGGAPLDEALRRPLGFTGKVIRLIGGPLPAAVVPWAWFPMRFQADRVILHKFMFP